jgi:hypothetical protein
MNNQQSLKCLDRKVTPVLNVPTHPFLKMSQIEELKNLGIEGLKDK